MSIVSNRSPAPERLDQGLQGEDKAKALLGMADWLQAEGFHRRAAETYSKVRYGAHVNTNRRRFPCRILEYHAALGIKMYSWKCSVFSPVLFSGLCLVLRGGWVWFSNT